MEEPRARIGVGTLYGYFRDKRDILFEVFARFSEGLQEVVLSRLDPEQAGGDDPRELTRQLIDAVFHLQTLRPGMQRVLWERYFKDPDFHEPIEEVRERLRAAVERFARSVDPKLLRDDLDLAVASLDHTSVDRSDLLDEVVEFGDDHHALDDTLEQRAVVSHELLECCRTERVAGVRVAA